MAANDKLLFLYTDFCPFAQRTWIALLEKEANPAKPVNFESKLVSLLNKSPEFLAANPAGEVPTGIHRGKNLFESLQFNDYVEETFAADRPLLPSAPFARWNARVLISRHTPGVVFGFYSMLKEGKVEQYLESLRKFQKDIAGPYLLGEQYSLADIAFFPFVERAVLTGSFYHPTFTINTEEFAKLRRWYELISNREAVKITTADRTDASMAFFPYGARDRAGYMREVYASYAYDQIAYAKELLKNAPAGVTTVKVDDLKKRKEIDAAEKKTKELEAATKVVEAARSAGGCCSGGKGGDKKHGRAGRRLKKAIIPLVLGLAIGAAVTYAVAPPRK